MAIHEGTLRSDVCRIRFCRGSLQASIVWRPEGRRYENLALLHCIESMHLSAPEYTVMAAIETAW